MAAILVAACGGGTLPHAPATLGEMFRSTAEAARSTVGQAAPTAQPPAQVRAAPIGQGRDAPVTTAAPAGKVPLRSVQGLRALFAKGTVDGAELITELVALRALTSTRRSAAVVDSLLYVGSNPAPTTTGRAPSVDLQAELQKAALKSLEGAVKPYLSSVGLGALDVHLGTLTDDPKLLREERIKLPSPQNLSQVQMQRIVNMAAIVLATRATSKILRRAALDFAGVEQDYQRLIERREQAAKVLYDVMLKQGGGSAVEIAGLYSDEDLVYLRQFSKMPLASFAGDLGAQNLALRYLRKSDPSAWGDYKGKSDGLRSITQGYIRSVAGVTAFAALLANFGNETLGKVRQMSGAEMVATFPFAVEFAKEVPPLLKASWDVAAAGVVEVPSAALKRFRLVGPGAAVEDVRTASDVFAAIKKNGSAALFDEALFRTGSDGLVYKLFRCDRSEAGRMLDIAVPLSQRENFASEYFRRASPAFSFQNAFSTRASEPRERELGDDLLRADHRMRTTVVAFGQVQRSASEGAMRWNNDQLIRLVLANREGAAAHATLQLGEFMIRLVPSMQSVYAYESLADSCAEQFGGARASR